MPKGVTQDQVNAAIDALVARGERPTIERVRLALGTGSPNTLTRMLDAWWAHLHERLTRQQAKLAVPEAPDDVALAATRLWQLALEHAGAQAERGTAGQREALARDQAALATERVHWQQQLESAITATGQSDDARRAAEARLADLQRLLEQQSTQLADLQGRLTLTQRSSDELATRLETSQQALLAARAEASRDRSALEASHRAAEDRWMQEVDRARRDEAKTSTRLQHVESAAQAAAKAASTELAAAATQQRKLEQELARKDARVTTLTDQLDRLHQRMATALAGQRPATQGRRAPAPATSKRTVKAR